MYIFIILFIHIQRTNELNHTIEVQLDRRKHPFICKFMFTQLCRGCYAGSIWWILPFSHNSMILKTSLKYTTIYGDEPNLEYKYSFSHERHSSFKAGWNKKYSYIQRCSAPLSVKRMSSFLNINCHSINSHSAQYLYST